MSRKIVYVNGQNETITFEDAPYLITTIEGLGIPNIDRQEQKAPYQDGTTYIDALLQNRDIVVELAITKPNNFADIATYRRELSQRLCPKYGLGTLTYTDEDNNSYAIPAVVASMVFPNKDFREPFMRAMVTFTACDPYWKKTTSETENVLATTVGAANTITLTGYKPVVRQAVDGTYYAAFIRIGDGVVTASSLDGVTWNDVAVIADSATGGDCAFNILLDHSYFLVYRRASDNAFVYRRSVDFVTWSAPVVLASATYTCIGTEQLSNGKIIVAYYNVTTPYIISSDSFASWSAPSAIAMGGSGYMLTIGKDSDDRIFATFSTTASASANTLKVVYSSDYGVSWSSSYAIFTNGGATTIVQMGNGIYRAFYVRTSDYAVVRKDSSSLTTWTGLEVPIGITLALYSTFFGLLNLDGLLSFYYSVVAGAPTTYESYFRAQVAASAPVVILGDVAASPKFTFNGPAVFPTLWKQETKEYIRLTTTLLTGEYFEVDTTFGNKTVRLVQGGIVKNGIAFLDIGSTFFQLERGSNVVYFEDDAVASTATATMEWTERYVGV